MGRKRKSPPGPHLLHLEVLLCSTGRIHDVAYTDTEHHRGTRRFLSDPGRALETLLGEEPDADTRVAGDS